LFTNIDAIVPASAVFLAELESVWMARDGEARVGEICLKHVSDSCSQVDLAYGCVVQGLEDDGALPHVSEQTG
jgi:hypothetical protein